MTKIDSIWIADQRAKMEECQIKWGLIYDEFETSDYFIEHRPNIPSLIKNHLAALDEIERLSELISLEPEVSVAVGHEEVKRLRRQLSEAREAVRKFLENWDEAKGYINGAIAMEANRGRPYAGPYLDLEGLIKILK